MSSNQNHLSPSPELEAEIEFIKNFITPKKQDRVLGLITKKCRPKLRRELHKIIDKDMLYIQKLPAKVHTSDQILDYLIKKGAPDHCHLISEHSNYDSQLVPLKDALDKLAGSGINTLFLCKSNRLAFCEGEGLSNRFILEK